MKKMHPLHESSLVLALGFLADRALALLEESRIFEDPDEPDTVLNDIANRLEWLYLAEASEVALKSSDYLTLRCDGLLEAIQGAAHRKGRMVSYMAGPVVTTLRNIAQGDSVSGQERDEAKQLLGIVSEGTLVYEQQLQSHGR